MKKFPKVSVVLGLALVSLVACGSDSSGSDATGSSPAAAEATTQAPAAAVTTQAPATVATTTQAPAASPTIGDVKVDCLNRGLRVNATVNKGSSDINRVVVKRANDEGAELETRMTFLGPDTGAGNEWSAVNVAGAVDRITVVATDKSGKTVSSAKDFNLPC